MITWLISCMLWAGITNQIKYKNLLYICHIDDFFFRSAKKQNAICNLQFRFRFNSNIPFVRNVWRWQGAGLWVFPLSIWSGDQVWVTHKTLPWLQSCLYFGLSCKISQRALHSMSLPASVSVRGQRAGPYRRICLSHWSMDILRA